MALTYKNGRPYAYRSVRIGGRVTSEYLASGQFAELLGSMAADIRASEQAARVQAAETGWELEEINRGLDDLVAGVKGVAGDVLSAAGCHQHHGQWRRRRFMSETTIRKPAAVDPGRSLDHWVVNRLIAWCLGSGATDVARGVLLREIGDVSRELAGPDPTPTERMLSETAATAWFAVRRLEGEWADTRSDRAAMQLDRANRRLTGILRTLAAVRRLAVRDRWGTTVTIAPTAPVKILGQDGHDA